MTLGQIAYEAFSKKTEELRPDPQPESTFMLPLYPVMPFGVLSEDERAAWEAAGEAIKAATAPSKLNLFRDYEGKEFRLHPVALTVKYPAIGELEGIPGRRFHVGPDGKEVEFPQGSPSRRIVADLQARQAMSQLCLVRCCVCHDDVEIRRATFFGSDGAFRDHIQALPGDKCYCLECAKLCSEPKGKCYSCGVEVEKVNALFLCEGRVFRDLRQADNGSLIYCTACAGSYEVKPGDKATSQQPAPVPNSNPALWGLVMIDMVTRDQFGLAKYKTRLQAGNGRDFLADAYQEALDLAVYLRGAIFERDGK